MKKYIQNLFRFINKNKIMLICLVLFITATFSLTINHTAHWDESHAWMLAKFMNFTNWKNIVSTEGHPLFWYLLLMPFAKTNFHYPYPMYLINYIFCLLSLFVLWKKAPFNNIIKIIITFSGIFLSFYAISARNYTIGILGLFIIASLYKHAQTKRPVLYASAIALTIHTHILAAFGALSFALIFFLKTVQNHKNLKLHNIIISFLIILLSCAFFVYPFLNGYSNPQNLYFAPPGLFRLADFCSRHIFIFVCYILSVISFAYVYKDKFSKIFYLSTFALLLMMFQYFYSGVVHHYLFFTIYLILSLWIAEIETTARTKNQIIPFVLLACILLFPINRDLKYMFPSNIKPMINYINNEQSFEGKNLYLAENIRYALPYISEKIHSKDLCSLKDFSWQTYAQRCQDVDISILPNESLILTKSILYKIPMIASYNGVYLYMTNNKR